MVLELGHPKMHPPTKFEIPTFVPQIMYEICSVHNYFRNEARGQGHSNPKIDHNTLPSQDASTDQI